MTAPPPSATTTTAGGGPATGRGVGSAPAVFWGAMGLIVAFVLFAVVAPDAAADGIGAVQASIVDTLGWYYVLLIAIFVVFALAMGFSRFGDIRLGRDDEDPEFGIKSWFAMLFSAGMGIGLVFWGVAEPLNHFVAPRPGFDGGEVETARRAMTQTYLHWGIHAWAIYVVAGLAIAYSVHRKGYPVSIRWALEPLLGDRVKGRLGDLIDITAVVGTVFGVATSLGFGVAQIAAGLDFTGVVDGGSGSVGLQVVLIVVITAIATASVVSGVGRGIKWLSNFNMGLAALLLVFILVAGPTIFLLREFVQNFGDYFTNVLGLSFDVSAYRGADGEAWQASWTTFYWGWWVSWAPFVGVFIARISRGRTVREFVLGVLLVPTLVTFLWFSVLGGTALHRELFGDGGLIADDGTVGTESSLFTLLDAFPGSTLVIGLTILLIVTFFVTSSDSGSLVVDMLASGGDIDPPKWSRIMWAVLEGAVAAALLGVGGGGLTALQTAAIVIALPFSVVMVAMMFATVRAFRAEVRAADRRRRAVELEAMTHHVTTRIEENAAADQPAGPGAQRA